MTFISDDLLYIHVYITFKATKAINNAFLKTRDETICDDIKDTKESSSRMR